MTVASAPDLRELHDDLGAALAVPAEPRRIVSLVPNLSEVLWWWHLADRVVGVTDWCVAPPRAFDDARRVRGTKNPDVSAIVDLAPDVVVANEEENRELDVQRLREAGIAVHVTRAHDVTGAQGALANLAATLGVPKAGEGLAQTIRRALDQVRPAPRPLRAVVPVWRDAPERGGDDEGWWTVGRDTFAGDLLAACGFEVLPADPDGRYPTSTLRDLLDLDPDVALLPDEPYVFGPDDARVFAERGVRARLLDGTALTWWGPRTPHAIGDLSRLARQLSRPRRRRHVQ